MKGQFIRSIDSHGFITLLLKMEDGGYGRVYTGQQYRNYSIWKHFKVGDWIDGLRWKDEKKKIIDGDSPAHLY